MDDANQSSISGGKLEELQVILRGLIALETPGPEAQAQLRVRNVLEESTREEPQNLRITFEDDEDVREAFNFADIDHSYLPGREEIKKQGLKLIDDKTKVVKKKQRGASKK